MYIARSPIGAASPAMCSFAFFWAFCTSFEIDSPFLCCNEGEIGSLHLKITVQYCVEIAFEVDCAAFETDSVIVQCSCYSPAFHS